MKLMRKTMKTKYDLYNDGIGSVEYVTHMGDDATIVNAARVSFGQHKDELDEKDEKLIKYLIKNRHTSTLEHNSITFRFTVPLFIRSQHHRHRTWSYNEISRRYTKENLQFFEPKTFRTQHKTDRQASNTDEINPVVGYTPHHQNPIKADIMIKEHHRDCLSLFNRLVKGGVCREQARGVLPQNLYTSYYGTVNVNNALKFCSLRLDGHAQWEIQQVAQAMIEIMLELFPITIKAWIDCLPDGELKTKFLQIS